MEAVINSEFVLILFEKGFKTVDHAIFFPVGLFQLKYDRCHAAGLSLCGKPAECSVAPSQHGSGCVALCSELVKTVRQLPVLEENHSACLYLEGDSL